MFLTTIREERSFIIRNMHVTIMETKNSRHSNKCITTIEF